MSDQDKTQEELASETLEDLLQHIGALSAVIGEYGQKNDIVPTDMFSILEVIQANLKLQYVAWCIAEEDMGSPEETECASDCICKD
jgi:hypothetical protein